MLSVDVWTIVQSKKSQEGMFNLAKRESPSPAPLRESRSRTETPAQSAGGVTPPNESAPTALADAVASRAKDGARTFSPEEEKLKADRASALAANTPTPGVVASTAPAPEAANLEKAVQQKAIAGRDAPEGFARDARADKSLSARRAPAQEPAATAAEKVEAARALPVAPTEDLRVARRIGGRPGTAGAELAGASVRATPPPGAPAPLSLSTQ